MFRNATPKKVIAFLSVATTLSYCWPPSSTATRLQVIRYKFFRLLALVNLFIIMLPLVYAVHVHRDDPETIAKSACLSIPFLKDFLQMCFCMAQYDRFQRLIDEMNEYCEAADPDEQSILQRYVNKYTRFYGVSVIWFYTTGTMVIVGALVTPEPFPTKAEYPFAVDCQPTRSIVFIQQSIALLQVSSHVCITILGALLMLFAAARFETLMIEMRAVRDLQTLIECMKKYYSVKRYALEVVEALRFIALLVVCVCIFAAVLCGVTFLSRQPIAVKIPFFFVAGTAFLEIFMYVWAADHLIDMSENVMQGVYESAWYEQSVRLQKTVLLMIVPQPPVAIRISMIIPLFSLNYYCSFISNVFSLFTALRVVILDDEDKVSAD